MTWLRRRTIALQESAALAEALAGDPVFLDETVGTSGTLPIKLISPGWGTSGYYPADVLERDGGTAFPAGTHMYFDHPTASEAADRPERSLRDLAGVLTTPATWQADHPSGPGLYAEAKPMEPYAKVLAEMAPHIGVSIRATGTAAQGEMEGRKGPVISSLAEGRSVDFVTKAGRGGQILPLLEAARAEMTQPDRLAEAARIVDLFESDLTYEDRYDALRDAVSLLVNGSNPAPDNDRYIYVQDFSDTWVVWSDRSSAAPDPGLFQALYTMNTDGTDVNLGTPVKVVARTEYVPDPEQAAPAAPPAPPIPTTSLEAAVPDPTAQELQESNTQLTTALEEANTRAARLEETGIARDARDHIVAAVAKVDGIPTLTSTRLVEALAAQSAPVTEDRKLDVAKLDEAIATAVTAELDYLVALGAPKVKGLGSSTGVVAEADTSKTTDRLASSFQRLGLSESAAQLAATGR